MEQVLLTSSASMQAMAVISVVAPILHKKTRERQAESMQNRRKVTYSQREKGEGGNKIGLTLSTIRHKQPMNV